MSRKIKLYIATSLNGKIARADGDVDWLESMPNPDKLDYGYLDFQQSIDTTIQGYNTYKKILDWDIPFPYPNTTNYVLTRKQNLESNKEVQFITKNHLDFIKDLKQAKGKDIWLIGGGQINTLLFNENLIDEIQLFIMPIVLPDGIEIFEFAPLQKQLKLIESKTYSTGVVELRYIQ